MASPVAADNYAALAPVSDGARLEARHLIVTPERVTITDDWSGAGQSGFVLHLPRLSDDGDFIYRLPRSGTEFVDARITHDGQAVPPLSRRHGRTDKRFRQALRRRVFR